MHKRVWTRMVAMLLTILLLSVTLINTGLATSVVRDLFVAADGSASPATSAQAVQDTLYVLLQDTIVSITDGQDAPALVLNFADYPDLNREQACLTSDGKTLYLLCPNTGEVYQLDGAELKKAATLNIDELGTDIGDGSRYVSFRCPIVQGGFLYALYMDMDTYPDNVLYRFSMQTGERIQLLTHPYSLAQIAHYKENQILGVGFQTRRIIAIDAETGKPDAETGTVIGTADGAAAYDAANDRIVSLSGAEVVLWENGKPVTVDYLALSEDSGVYAGIWSGSYVYLDRTGLYIRNGLSGANVIKPLNIVDAHNFAPTKTINSFMKQNPDIPIVTRVIDNWELFETISTAVLTKDASTDIFIVANTRIDEEALFKLGFAYPLNSPTLKDDVASMYTNIRDFLIKDEVLYGFPMALELDYWTVRPELLKEAQISDIPTTFDAFYDLMLTWYETFYDEHPGYHFFDGSRTVEDEWQNAINELVVMYIQAYASAEQPLSFNTPPFRSVLEKLAALSKWQDSNIASVHSTDYNLEHSIFSSKRVSPFSQSRFPLPPDFQDMYPDYSGEEYILPPVFAEGMQPQLNTFLYYFIVNPYSENKDAAIKFIEFYSQNMETEIKHMLHPDYNELIERPEFKEIEEEHLRQMAILKESINELKERFPEIPPGVQDAIHSNEDKLAQNDASFAEAQKTRWVFSPEVIAKYRAVAPYMSLEHAELISPIYEEVRTSGVLSRYFQGSLTLDQALTELDRKVALMFLEAQ